MNNKSFMNNNIYHHNIIYSKIMSANQYFGYNLYQFIVINL